LCFKPTIKEQPFEPHIPNPAKAVSLVVLL
jgi:hypothetical protein